jgi:hypothetical protein
VAPQADSGCGKSTFMRRVTQVNPRSSLARAKPRTVPSWQPLPSGNYRVLSRTHSPSSRYVVSHARTSLHKPLCLDAANQRASHVRRTDGWRRCSVASPSPPRAATPTPTPSCRISPRTLPCDAGASALERTERPVGLTRGRMGCDSVICLDDYHAHDRQGRKDLKITALCPEAQAFGANRILLIGLAATLQGHAWHRDAPHSPFPAAQHLTCYPAPTALCPRASGRMFDVYAGRVGRVVRCRVCSLSSIECMARRSGFSSRARGVATWWAGHSRRVSSPTALEPLERLV